MSLDVNISEPEEFNCVELHSSIRSLAGVLEISDFEYHVDHINGGGQENFIANIFRVVIHDTNADKQVSVIVKTLINTTRQELFHELHKREVAVYNDIMPKFREIQSNLDVEQRIKLPKCLLANAEKRKEVIILQDLKEIGFTPDDALSKFEELEFNKVKIILTELAKFHALSVVYECKHSEEFKEIKQNFQDLLFQDHFLSKSKLKNYFFESFDMSLNVLKDFDIKKKLELVRPRLLEILKFYNKPAKFNVLCHGDLWINNILFKQEEDQCKICFLDFQAMRYTSPVNDIVYFIYLCTTSQFRSEHMQNLLDSYYDALNSSLRLHDLDVKILYPQKDFEEDIKNMLPYGLLISLIELRILTMTAENDAILKSSQKVPGSSMIEVPCEMEQFKYRVNDLVQESVNSGVLEQLLNDVKKI